MNLAILLGVSKYQQPGSDLPACDNDLRIMHDVFNKIQKFDEILTIDHKMSSAKTKQKISEFVEKYKEENIKEVVFYYTGHGEFDETDFYYILSDYNPTRKRQTALQNSELDNWLRSLKSELTIKIVDACYSGVRYIKDVNSFKSYLNETQAVFANCYFMFSSHSNQTSQINGNFSDFTLSFLSSISEYQGSSIRYKDIIDFISDEFQNNNSQIPYFVTQGSNTEKFGDISNEVKNFLAEQLKTKYEEEGVGEKEHEEPRGFLEAIKEDAERYCTKEEFFERLDCVLEHFNNYKMEGDINELYRANIAIHADYPEFMKNIKAVGDWLKDVENRQEYFAEITTEKEPYQEIIQVPKKASSHLFSSLESILGNYQEKEVTKYREKTSGVRLTQEVPFSAISIEAEPKLESLNWYSCFIIYIFSKIEIRFFYSYSKYKQINWNEKVIPSNINWKTISAPLKDTSIIIKSIDKILNDYENEIMKPILEKYTET